MTQLDIYLFHSLITVPSSPRNVTVVYKTPTSLLVTWVSPFIPNGVLTMYEVTYTGVSSVNPVPDSFFQLLSITVSAANTSLVLQHLVPYSNYTISVRAFTSVGPGKYSKGIEDRTEEDGELIIYTSREACLRCASLLQHSIYSALTMALQRWHSSYGTLSMVCPPC